MAWNGQLFHVEQFEIASNDRGFRFFLTVKRTVRDGRFYGRTDGDLRWAYYRHGVLDTSLLVARDGC